MHTTRKVFTLYLQKYNKLKQKNLPELQVFSWSKDYLEQSLPQFSISLWHILLFLGFLASLLIFDIYVPPLQRKLLAIIVCEQNNE